MAVHVVVRSQRGMSYIKSIVRPLVLFDYLRPFFFIFFPLSFYPSLVVFPLSDGGVLDLTSFLLVINYIHITCSFRIYSFFDAFPSSVFPIELDTEDSGPSAS